MKRVIALLLTVVLLVAGSGCGRLGGGTFRVSALFNDSAGLFVGNDVGILGVPVGKVVSITPQGADVRVVMEINDGQAIPANAGAVVVSRSVATDRYVELTPVYHSGPRMTAGTVINEDRTRTPVDFDQVLAALNTFATGISGSKATRDAVKRTLAVQSHALDGNGVKLNKTIHSLSAAVNGVAGERNNLTSTLLALDNLTTTLADNQATVRTFIQQVSEASQLLAAERGDFRTSLTSLSQAVEVVAQFTRTNKASIVKTLNNTTGVAKQVLSSRQQIVEVLNEFPVVLQNLQRAYKNGRITVRINPTVLLPLGGFLDQICAALPIPLCNAFGTDPLGVSNLLDQLLGGK
jgi:phospholipid/cholesterol/gamma-HCH transport system substrate-binding protein